MRGNISIIGVGSSANRILDMSQAEDFFSDWTYIALDTSADDLAKLKTDYKMLMGYNIVPESNGTRGDYHRGKTCAMKSIPDILELTKNSSIVLLVTNMWGGTSVGAADEVAASLKKAGKKVITLCAMPHIRAPENITSGADRALEVLKEKSDSIIMVNPNKEFNNLGDTRPIYDMAAKYIKNLMELVANSVENAPTDISENLISGGYTLGIWHNIDRSKLGTDITSIIEKKLEDMELTDRSIVSISINSQEPIGDDDIINLKRKLERALAGHTLQVKFMKSRSANLSMGMIITHIKQRTTMKLSTYAGSKKKKSGRMKKGRNADLLSFRNNIDWVS